VKLLLVVPKDCDVDILVGTRLAPHPELQRLAPTTHQGARKLHMRLESREGSKSSHLQRSA
jgi:hypothetical protein